VIALSLTDEQSAIVTMVRELMTEQVAPRAREIDEAQQFPGWVADLFRRYDLFAAAVPEEYGGLDGRHVTLCLILEQLARVCGSCSMILGVQALGSGPIALFGSAEQKRRWLPAIAAGETMVAFGLTEPDAGSDVRSMRSRAVPVEGGWRLSGRKSFISHAIIADLCVIFAKVKGEDGGDQISAFLVETDQPGFTVDKVEHKMGLRGSPTCSLVLEDAWVPEENLIGEVGEGMQVLLGTLHKSRIHSAAQSLGVAQGALDLSAAYVTEREQFGRALAQMPGVQAIVGRMATDVAAARCLIFSAAARWDAGSSEIATYSAMAKLFGSDVAMRVTTDAVQIMGGYGYTVEYEVERFMRDAKVFQIFEGANELHEMAIGRATFGSR
jgi:alkylation response protein AidB-like acyl-CoA dehydrogenase